MEYLSFPLNALYYIAYPLFYILYLVFAVLTIITAPLLHLGHYFLYACYYPIHILGKFETLYIFLGVAVLVGFLTGTSLHYASSFLASLLNLESHPEEQRGRTLASFQKGIRDKRKNHPSIKSSSYGRGGLEENDIAYREDLMGFGLAPLGDPGKVEKGKGNPQKFDAMLKEEPMDFEWPKQGRVRAKNDLIPHTILEEDSTEDDF